MEEKIIKLNSKQLETVFSKTINEAFKLEYDKLNEEKEKFAKEKELFESDKFTLSEDMFADGILNFGGYIFENFQTLFMYLLHLNNGWENVTIQDLSDPESMNKAKTLVGTIASVASGVGAFGASVGGYLLSDKVKQGVGAVKDKLVKIKDFFKRKGGSNAQ